MQACDQRCGWCAKNFWCWLKAREAQMSVPRKGEKTTFTQAALTSVKPID